MISLFVSSFSVKKYLYDKKFWVLTAAAVAVFLILITALLIFILKTEKKEFINKKDVKVLRTKKEDRLSANQEAR